MIVGELKQWRTLPGLEGLEAAFQFLEKNRGQELPLGKQPVQDDDIYAIVVRTPSRPAEGAQFEAHRKYIDVQYLDAGMETIGYAPVDQLKIARLHDEAKDIEFYDLPQEYEKLSLYPGRFAVFFPGDAHLPNCHLGGEHQLSKIVVKVLASLLKKE